MKTKGAPEEVSLRMDVLFCFQIHRKLRTKALVLELLAAICLAVKGGHDIILAAFDFFKVKENKLRKEPNHYAFLPCPTILSSMRWARHGGSRR